MAQYLALKIAENVAVGMEGVAAYLRRRKCSTNCGELEPQPANVVEACKTLAETSCQRSDSIYEVYKPTGAEPEVDLLFFHDLHEACEPFPHFSTWTSSASSPEVVVWPGTWIPEMFPFARVLIVRYDGALEVTRTRGRMDINIISENIYTEITRLGVGTHPVILIGHGVGGILIQAVCRLVEHGILGTSCYRSLMFIQQLIGVFFYGTPSRGIDHPYNEPGFDKQHQLTRSPLLMLLKTFDPELCRIHEEFSSFLRRYPNCQVFSVGESRETMLRLKHFKQPAFLVPHGSSIQGGTATVVEITGDHLTICKPDCPSSCSFVLLTNFIIQCQDLERSRKRNPVWKSEAGLEHVYLGFRLQCSRDSTLSGNFFHKVQDKLCTKLTDGLKINAENFRRSDNLFVIRHAGHEVFILYEGPHHIDILVRTVHSCVAAQFVKRHVIEEIKSLHQSEGDYSHKKRSLGLGFFRKECVKQVVKHEFTRNILGPRFSRKECVKQVSTHELRGKQSVVLVKDLEKTFRTAINETCKSISPKLWMNDEDVLRGIVFHTWPSMENNQGQVLLPCTHESVFEILRVADREALNWIVAEICTTHESIKDPTIRRKSDELYELRNVEDPNMTIIFFHGFCRTADEADSVHLSTWITQSEESTDPWAQLWPKTWLAVTFPRARIFTAKYDTSLVVTSRAGRVDLYQLGEQLVNGIIDLPDWKPGISELPVVLVGHCIGGIIMEQFLLSAHRTRFTDSPEKAREKKIERFLKNVGLLFYYSTPHRGLTVLTTTANEKSPMLEAATVFNTEVARLHQDLNRIPADVRKWRVAGVGATLPTNWPAVGFDGILVEEGSSREGDYVSVNKDHFSICRPERRTSNAFLFLVNSIKSTIDVQ